jgi:hypothetical protein
MPTEAQQKRPSIYQQARAIASRLLSMGRGAAWSLPVRAATPLTLAAVREAVAEVDPHASPAGTYAHNLSNGAQLVVAADRRATEPELRLVKGGQP